MGQGVIETYMSSESPLRPNLQKGALAVYPTHTPGAGKGKQSKGSGVFFKGQSRKSGQATFPESRIDSYGRESVIESG